MLASVKDSYEENVTDERTKPIHAQVDGVEGDVVLSFQLPYRPLPEITQL